MVQRSVRTPGARLDAVAVLARDHIPWRAARVVALLLPWALTGCPFSDNYFVDPNYNVAGGPSHGGGTGALGGNAGTAGGNAGAGMSAGGAVAAGNGGSGGALAGTGGDTGGTGGTGGAGTGGDTALGGTSGAGATGGGSTGGDAGQAGSGPEAGAGGEGPCVPEPEVCDGKSNGCDGVVDEGVCPQHCTAQQHDGRVYVLCLWALAANGPDYETAETRCAGMGAELGLDGDFALAFVESEDENTFLKDWIGTSTSVADGAVWMGANDIAAENTWVWGQGPDAVQFFRGYTGGGGTAYMGRYDDFGPGRPNSSNETQEDCGAFDAEVTWQWNDRQCTDNEIGFVCEQQP